MAVAQKSTVVTRRRPVLTKNELGVLVANRGGRRIEIQRPRALRAPIANTESSARRFERIMKDIIARCESLSVETNCWLHIVAQHQTSGRDFLGYVSPRLLRSDAEGVNNIQQAWGTVFQNLLKAARQEALELTKALNDARAQLEHEKMGRLQLERQVQGMTTPE